MSGVLTATRGREQWLLVGLLLAVLLGMSYKYRIKSLDHRGAIDRWRNQLLDMEGGKDIYRRDQYPNPPIMALLLTTLIHLPPLAASLGWFWFKVGLTFLGLHWLFRWVAEKGAPFPLWAKALTVVLALRPILGDLEHGNINLFILFLVLAFLTLYQHKRDLLAGVTLALAAACKVTPGLFMPYLVWKRSWRALAGCAVGLALFHWPGFVPAAFLGWEKNQEYLSGWYHGMVQPFVVEGKVTTDLVNQSLPGVVYRLATHSPAETEWNKTVNDYVPLRYANLLDLSTAQAKWLVKGCMGLFALLVVWCCRTPTASRGGWRLSAEFSLVVLGMLLFSERTWKHHCVTLVLPFAVLSYYLATQRAGLVLRTYLGGTLAAVMLLIASTSNGILPKAWAEQTQIYGAYVGANLLLIAALAVLLKRPVQPGQLLRQCSVGA
jgi:hypothetical protein